MIIGKEATHGNENPVPELWERCFKYGTLKVLEALSPEMEYYIGWMGDYNGKNLDVFPRLHDLTIEGIEANGYVPDYSHGWSAEVYPKNLSFEATEGTVNYICPCKIK
ncbi:MAG: hypothetical protein LBI27_04165 [Clostridiales bacterium]|jgi:AraC family transcriptional regulator|nr:hypothetical protein [Clostridiales bacterium]